ncbi:MAG: TlpA family protein disulfide reductase, partial [Myxococcales bacterium]|nr:TlpA family protein disulfide reductase [Myxococcales bacterium]
MTRWITILADGKPHGIAARVREARVLVGGEDLTAVLGWELKAEGLCRAGICVPTGRLQDLRVGDPCDLERVGEALDRPFVVDVDEAVAAFGPAPVSGGEDLWDLPDLALGDLNGKSLRLRDLRGRKVLLVAYASWCGCREDLPAWSALHDELEADGLTVVTVALDRNREDARPFIERAAPRHPSLVDTEHQLADRLSIMNVPTALWVDETGRVVRSNETAFATDTFREFHGQASGPYLAAVRRWVREGVVPGASAAEAPRLGPDERRAKAHGAIAF